MLRCRQTFERNGPFGITPLVSEHITGHSVEVGRRVLYPNVLAGQDIWVEDPAAYFYGVARNVLRDQWRNAERPIPLECLPAAEHPVTCHVELDRGEAERREMERCLDKLDS